MNKIQNTSKYILIILNILLIILPLYTILIWAFIETESVKFFIAETIDKHKPLMTPEGYLSLSSFDWKAESKLTGFISDLLGILPIFIGLLCLKKLFSNYKIGEIFSALNAKYYHQIAWLFFIDAIIIKPLSQMLKILAVTLDNPTGHKYITMGFDTENITELFCGVLILVISWVMKEASEIYKK